MLPWSNWIRVLVYETRDGGSNPSGSTKFSEKGNQMEKIKIDGKDATIGHVHFRIDELEDDMGVILTCEIEGESASVGPIPSREIAKSFVEWGTTIITILVEKHGMGKVLSAGELSRTPN